MQASPFTICGVMLCQMPLASRLCVVRAAPRAPIHSAQYRLPWCSPTSLPQDWSVVKTFPDMPKKGVTALLFGAEAKTLFVGAADHNLRVIGLSDNAMQE